jgi:hypothetical protein
MLMVAQLKKKIPLFYEPEGSIWCLPSFDPVPSFGTFTLVSCGGRTGCQFHAHFEVWRGILIVRLQPAIQNIHSHHQYLGPNSRNDNLTTRHKGNT